MDIFTELVLVHSSAHLIGVYVWMFKITTQSACECLIDNRIGE